MYVDVMQVRSAEVLIYRQWMGARSAPKEKNSLFGDKKAYSGSITDGSRKRLSKAVSLLVQKSPTKWINNPVTGNSHQFRIGFVTLTVPDEKATDAKALYSKCLSKYLRWFRSTGATDYVWKVELQKRGVLHYHIATNQFVHWKDSRDVWNKYLKQAGYLQSFAKKHGHFKPNSSDVHAMRKIKAVEKYLVKYLSKTPGAQPINGKTWDASKNLKQAKYFTTELTPRNLDRLRSIAQHEHKGEHCTYYSIPQDSAIAIMDSLQQSNYRHHLSSI